MEDISTEDGRMWFVDSDFITGEGTEHLTINLVNNVTKEVSSLWLKEDEVKELIMQLQSWFDG